jgi:hypothetical protein
MSHFPGILSGIIAHFGRSADVLYQQFLWENSNSEIDMYRYLFSEIKLFNLFSFFGLYLYPAFCKYFPFLFPFNPNF